MAGGAENSDSQGQQTICTLAENLEFGLKVRFKKTGEETDIFLAVEVWLRDMVVL